MAKARTTKFVRTRGHPYDYRFLVACKICLNRQSGTKSEEKSEVSNLGEQVGHVAADGLNLPVENKAYNRKNNLKYIYINIYICG